LQKQVCIPIPIKVAQRNPTGGSICLDYTRELECARAVPQQDCITDAQSNRKIRDAITIEVGRCQGARHCAYGQGLPVLKSAIAVSKQEADCALSGVCGCGIKMAVNIEVAEDHRGWSVAHGPSGRLLEGPIAVSKQYINRATAVLAAASYNIVKTVLVDVANGNVANRVSGWES
jgi:hypothetical protein